MAAAIPPGEVVYGMQLPVQAQSSLFVADWERDAGREEIERVARTADRCGFWYVAVCDHVAIPEQAVPAMGAVWYDTIATLGLLAGVTSEVRLLSHVYVLPYRHPLQVASAFATLDALSGGRVIVGVGAGHLSDEFDALGVDFDQRGNLLDEAIDAVAAALSDELVQLDGPTWKTSAMAVAPRPLQRPRPPIWVGGSSRPALRRAARRGDGWLPQGSSRRKMPALIAYLREQREACGGAPIDIGATTEWIHVGDPGRDLGRRAIAGPAEEVAASLRELVAMGVNHLQVRFPSRSCSELEDQMEAFGREVAPLLAGAES